MSELLSFEISSALKSVIGKDLITNDFVAIFELVKIHTTLVHRTLI